MVESEENIDSDYTESNTISKPAGPMLHIAETTSGGPPEHDTDLAVTLPLEEALVGRGFICGKSGSGKSNTASVVIEEILEAGRPLLIVDVEGEYYGLKEQYELLHAGADETCDIQVGPEHGEKIATLAIERGVPIILDLSGFLDESEADALVGAVARALFATAKQAREPFPVFIEECHEFIPQTGSAGETSKAVLRIAKRGRKHGLGVVGISQRPASVDKDFITQCNWLVWHRLTWKNDTAVVKDVLGKPFKEEIEGLHDGEAYLVVDPEFVENVPGYEDEDEDVSSQVRLRVKFNRKRTYDAGQAPGLDDERRPELKGIDDSLVDELQEISDRTERRQDEIERLRTQLNKREEEIEALEAELADTKDIRGIMGDMIESVAGQGQQSAEADSEDGAAPPSGEAVSVTIEGTELQVPEVIKTEVMEIREGRREAETRAEQLEIGRDRHRQAAEHLAAWLDERPSTDDVEALQRFVAEFGELTDRHSDVVGRYAGVEAGLSEKDQGHLDRLRERAREAEERTDRLESELEARRAAEKQNAERTGQPGIAIGDADLTVLLQHETTQAAIETAIEHGTAADQHYSAVLSVLASAGEGNFRSAADVATPLDVSDATVRNVLGELHTANVVTRERRGRGYRYALDRDLLEQRVEVAERQAAIATGSESSAKRETESSVQ